MGFMILPITAVVFFLGIATQLQQLASALPGAGPAGRADSIAQIVAQQAETFATACLNAAAASPGTISASLPVTMPAGAIAPATAVCMTAAGPAGSRYVYGYMSGVAGAAGKIMTDTFQSQSWYRLQAAGQAVNLASGGVSAVPGSIPVGALLNYTQVTP